MTTDGHIDDGHIDGNIDLGRPTDGDVVALILADHDRFEDLLRRLRDVTEDRDAVRHAFSRLHVAHAVAEEEKVYPTLRTKDAIDEHEAEHGAEEHAEGHQALLSVLEAEEVRGERFDDLVEELAKVVNHHLTEEELTILNPAREDVPEESRRSLGADFAARRNELLEGDAGSVDDVRRIVEEARQRGLLD